MLSISIYLSDYRLTYLQKKNENSLIANPKQSLLSILWSKHYKVSFLHPLWSSRCALVERQGQLIGPSSNYLPFYTVKTRHIQRAPFPFPGSLAQ